MYSLKQSSHTSFDKLNKFLHDMVCNKSSSNHYVPVDIPLHATYYVDDIAVSGDDYQGIVQLKGYLNSHFHMKDLVQ